MRFLYNFQYARDNGIAISAKDSKGDKSSYVGSFTNVSQMWFLYNHNKPYTAKVYIEGPGTGLPIEIRNNKKAKKKDTDNLYSSGNDDDVMVGQGFGTGSYGINAKIARGCTLIKNKVLKTISNQGNFYAINSITIDVFGFSRGAASARSFVSRLYGAGKTETEGYKVSLVEHLKGLITSRTKIIVRFMGLFDTVSSYQYIHTKKENESIEKDRIIAANSKVVNYGTSINEMIHTIKGRSRLISYNFSNDVKELGLAIPGNVKTVVHLVAADEYRKFFALTRINSAHGRGTEGVLPGAHSDIGGGYKKVEKEQILMRGQDLREGQCRGFKSLKALHDGGWLPPGMLIPHQTLMKDGRVVKDYVDTQNSIRSVNNDYAHVPLKIMYKLATKYGVPINYDAGVIEAQYSLVKSTGEDLLKLALANKSPYRISNGKITYIGDNSLYRKIFNIRAEFIHLSAYDDSVWDTLFSFKNPNVAAPHNRRIIINDGV